jgi:hypothetical protein
MIVITPALYAGMPEEAAGRENGRYTPTASEAVSAMLEGLTAFIPVENWETQARLVLSQWLDTDQIEDRIFFAQTGRLRTTRSDTNRSEGDDGVVDHTWAGSPRSIVADDPPRSFV